jgi:DNA-formamidopyrimidine glycosylase
MPEYPEVKIIARQIDLLTYKSNLISIKVVKSAPEIFKKRVRTLNNALRKFEITLDETTSRGKYIYTKLKTPTLIKYIVSHLMLKGQWRTEKQTYSTVSIETHSRDDKPLKLWFGDSMKLAKIELLTQKEFDNFLAEQGPPLDEMTFAEFKNAAHNARMAGDFLMDQSKIAGIGNYLRAEILYDAKISPRRKCNSLDSIELHRLFNSIKKIPKEVLSSNGSDKYIDILGATGKYKMKVYGRKLDPSGNKITVSVVGGRKIFWVPKLQH